MTRHTWHIKREGQSLTLSRQLPARFDIAAVASFPMMGRLRLAQQVRQDMWRALRNVRGFSPVVQIETQGDGLMVRAGGRVDGRAPKAQLQARITDVLANPDNRARWARCAGGRS